MKYTDMIPGRIYFLLCSATQRWVIEFHSISGKNIRCQFAMLHHKYAGNYPETKEYKNYTHPINLCEITSPEELREATPEEVMHFNQCKVANQYVPFDINRYVNPQINESYGIY